MEMQTNVSITATGFEDSRGKRAKEQKGFEDSRVRGAKGSRGKTTGPRGQGFRRVGLEESSEKLIIQRIQGVSCKVSWIDVF
jgi:hypothetical protein